MPWARLPKVQDPKFHSRPCTALAAEQNTGRGCSGCPLFPASADTGRVLFYLSCPHSSRQESITFGGWVEWFPSLVSLASPGGWTSDLQRTGGSIHWVRWGWRFAVKSADEVPAAGLGWGCTIWETPAPGFEFNPRILGIIVIVRHPATDLSPLQPTLTVLWAFISFIWSPSS